MCVRSKEGYIMEDGTLISFGTPLQDISIEHINQLNEHKASSLEYFLISGTLMDINKKLDMLAPHIDTCPIKPDSIRKMIRNEIRLYPRNWWSEKSWFLKALSAVFGLFISIGTLLLIIKGLLDWFH